MKVEVKGEISVIIHINLEYALLNSVRVSPLGNAILVYVCTTRKKISFSCLEQELHLKWNKITQIPQTNLKTKQ